MKKIWLIVLAKALLLTLPMLLCSLANAQDSSRLTPTDSSQVSPQVNPLVSCVIHGSSSAALESTAIWTVNCTATNWSVSCGTVQSYTSSSVTIKFDQCGCSTSTITALGTTAPPFNVSVTWTALTGGAISSPTSQIIWSGITPTQINASLPTNGNCAGYSYQWYSSTNGTSWSPVSGATGQNYQPGALTATTYYKRDALDYTESAYTSNLDTVTVYPTLVSGTITPPTISVPIYKTPTTGFTISGTGGGNGSYTYKWLSASSSGGPYAYIPGATGTTYTPPASTSAVWYKVIQYSYGDSVTSGSAELIVTPEVFPGTILPSYLVITSGTSPGTLTGNPATGGACSGSFVYQWQSSTNGTSWSSISGANSLDYTAGTLTSSTWYRRMVICGVDTEYSNLAQIVVGTPNTNYNFIRVRDILKAGVTDTATADGLTSPIDVAQSTQYFDGLGRLVQTVAKQSSPLQNDMVKPVVYDNFGRQATDYLPYTATTSDGNFKPTALPGQDQFNSTQFPGENVYYGEVSYEASPLNRPLTAYAPGASWVGSNKGKSMQYLINTAADSVQLWTISSIQLALPLKSGIYAAGQLQKNVIADEQGNQVISYTDKFGRLVLKKQQVSASPSTGHYGWLCTYYVYDTLQNLRVIIQPQAVALINGTWTISQTIANELCFRYEYDGRRNRAIKKVPGAGQVWLVYDARNRVALTQDSALRASQKWLFLKYDGENRPDSSGTITDALHYTSLSYHDSLAYYNINYPTVSSYTNELLSQNFYDDYTWVSAYSAPVGASMATTYTSNSNYFITSYNTAPAYAVPVTAFPITRGMKTGSMQKVIGSSSTYLYTSMFFDDRGRSIQTQQVNYTGAIDTSTLQYNFSGAVLRQLINHKKSTNTVQNHIVLSKMDYDHRMRLRHVYKNIDNAPSDQLIDSLQYNELGQLASKYLGNRVDSLIYTYNIRGWLTGINKNYVAGTANHYFGMEIGYNSTSSVAPGNTYLNPELNGNIEGIVWKGAGSGINRKYDFSYDPASRLTGAAFLQNSSGSSWDKSVIDFSVSGITYDANGNLQTMTQRGFTIGGSSPIDSLTYTYATSSNKLMQVNDADNDTASQLGDFHYKGMKGSSDYSYDGNGNLAKDNNKGLDNFIYNYMNLLQQVHVDGKGFITYIYDAAGTKLQKQVKDSTTGTVTFTSYLGEFQYTRRAPFSNINSGSDTLQFIAHEEGRARWAYHKYTTGATAYKFEYDFFERDHLGNTRTVLTQERDTSNYLATMESAYRGTEVQLFGNITNTATAWTSMPNYTNILSTTRYAYTNPNDSVSKVDSTSGGGQKVGPNLLLKVMSGDTVNLSAQCYYVSPGGGNTNNSSFSDVLNSLGNGLVNLTGGAHGTLGNLTSSGSSVYSGLTSFLGSYDTAHTGYPKAYINWIFLDDQFNYVSALSGSVLAASSTYPAGSMNLVAPGAPIALNKSGYLYIWVSNETTGWDVYFDNLSVQYKQGPLLEESHYYPFGLTMAGISDKAIKTNYGENKYRYNSGNELQNKEFSDGSGLEIYDAGFRQFDPQLGRFAQIDPLSERTDFSSAYQYANNNPISMNDPTGLYAAKGHVNVNYSSGGGDPFGDGSYSDGSAGPSGNSSSSSNGAFWSNVLGTLSAGGDGSTWTSNGDGTGSYDLTDPGTGNGVAGGQINASAADLATFANEGSSGVGPATSSSNGPYQPYASYPIYDAGGEIAGTVDLIDFSNLEKNNGIKIILGFQDWGSGYSLGDLNWQQSVTTNDPLPGQPANTPYLDGWGNPYYYSTDPTNTHYVGNNYLNGSFGSQVFSNITNPVGYDLVFGDGPGRSDDNFSWQASLSLVVMGPNGAPSASLFTLTYGFTVQNGVVNPTWPQPK